MPAAGMSTPRSDATSGSSPTTANSVVPIPKALIASASSASGMVRSPSKGVSKCPACAMIAHAAYPRNPLGSRRQLPVGEAMAIDDDAVEVRAQGWRTLAALHGRIEDALERTLQAGFGLSVVEFTVLDTLDRQDGWHMRMQQLSRAAALSHSATTR